MYKSGKVAQIGVIGAWKVAENVVGFLSRSKPRLEVRAAVFWAYSLALRTLRLNTGVRWPSRRLGSQGEEVKSAVDFAEVRSHLSRQAVAPYRHIKIDVST